MIYTADQYLFKSCNYWLVITMFGFLLFQSCATKKSVQKNTGPADIRSNIVQSAERYLGANYKYGGTGSKGFDCSGLVSKVFYENKIDIRGNSEHLAKLGKTRKKEEARKGDLIFFMKDEKVNHVALITKKSGSEVWVIHSTSSRGVIKENIFASSYWKNKRYFIKDVL